jgi:hypothetical protein
MGENNDGVPSDWDDLDSGGTWRNRDDIERYFLYIINVDV